jgi:MFS family permease
MTPYSDQNVAPRLYYGWVMLAVATAVFIMTGPGQTVIVSQFNVSFRESLDLTEEQLGRAYMIGTVLAAFPLVLVGKASDRFGPRLVTSVVAILFAASCAIAGQAQGIVSLTIAFFLLRFLGQGALGLLSGHTIALWFERRHGTANGLKTMLTYLGFAAFPAVAIGLIDALGWRVAYTVLGAMVVIVVIPLTIFVSRDRPGDVGQRLDNLPPSARDGGEDEPDFDPAFTLREAVATRAFWTIALTLASSGMIGTALIFHSQPLLEARGADPTLSAAVLRTWSLTMTVAILPAGWLADRVHAAILLPLSLVLLGAASIAPELPFGARAMHASLAAFGVSQAIAYGAGAPTLARYFGRAHHGAVRSLATLISVVGTGLGPVILGASISRTGSFTLGLAAFVAVCALLIIASATLRAPRPPARLRVRTEY